MNTSQQLLPRVVISFFCQLLTNMTDISSPSFNNISLTFFSDQIMSKMQFLLHIHKEDLFVLPTPTEVGFSTTNCPRFYCSSSPSQSNHSSLLRTNRFGGLLNHGITTF